MRISLDEEDLTMRLFSVTIVLLAASFSPAVAQTPPDVSDLVGARGAGGETQLERSVIRCTHILSLRGSWRTRRM
jgi:hypothetical protein